MRIALVSREFPPTRQSSGIATYTEKTSRTLATAGHEVHVISEAHEGAPTGEERGGALIHRLPDPRLRPRERSLLRRAGDVARAIRRLGPFDVVQACEWEGEAALYSLRPDYPLITRLATPLRVVEELNGTPLKERLRSLVVRGMERWQARHSSLVICPSRHLAQRVAEDWGLDASDIAIVPTGIELPPPGPSLPEHPALRGRRYLLYFGRLEERKGVRAWIDALPEVLEANPGLEAVFAGEDLKLGGLSYVEYGRSRCGALASRLHFLPRLPHPELFPLIAHARLVVLPSRFESIANACLETMALGRPVVATERTGFAELLEEGVSGFLVPPDDPAALARVVNSALARPELLERMGGAAAARAQEFELGRMGARLLEVYRDVAGDQLAGATS